MTATNTSAAGMSLQLEDPMNVLPGPNTAPNLLGIPNVANYICCGGNQHNLGTLRTATVDIGTATGLVSSMNSAKMDPVQGSSKYFLQGMPVTRLGDMGMTNNFNIQTTQVVPSQTKYFVNT